MPLDPAKIAALRAKKDKPRSPGTRKSGGRRGSKKVDLTTVESRTMDVWFSLDHHFQQENEETGHVEMIRCDSPDCHDPRTPEKGGIMVVEINGRYCCRYCFLDGYLTVDPDQQTITDKESEAA